MCKLLCVIKEHNHVFAHVQDFDFWTGCHEFKDARINVELSQICSHYGAGHTCRCLSPGSFQKGSGKG